MTTEEQPKQPICEFCGRTIAVCDADAKGCGTGEAKEEEPSTPPHSVAGIHSPYPAGLMPPLVGDGTGTALPPFDGTQERVAPVPDEPPPSGYMSRPKML